VSKRSLLLLITLMLSGRAMTLAFIHRAGGGGTGDPPDAWLMPLLGDAVIGLSALGVAYLIWWGGGGLWAWTTIIVWNALAVWDALAAFIVNTTNPWPEFFMLRTFGPSMFFVAGAMHLVAIALAGSSDLRRHFGLDTVIRTTAG
jgi:hypothetical protein